MRTWTRRRTAFVAALIAALPCLAADRGDVTLSALDVDPGFGVDGFVQVAGSGTSRLDTLRFVRLDSEGRIVVAGQRFVSGDPQYGTDLYVPGVARFLADGSIDTSFGDEGVAMLPSRGSVGGLALDAADRVTVTGIFFWRTDRASDPGLYGAARLDAAGELDAGFGDDGFVPIASNVARLRTVAPVASDASLLVAQDRQELIDGNWEIVGGLVRITEDGDVDPAYGQDGFAPTGFLVNDLVVRDDGAVVASGPGGVARFDAAGVRDFFFGDLGALVDSQGGVVSAAGVEPAQDGRLLVYGDAPGLRTGLYRFLADGTPDASFGDAGFVRVRSGRPADAASGGVSFAAAGGGSGVAVVTSNLTYFDQSDYFENGRGSCVQAIDSANPGALAVRVTRVPDDSVSIESFSDVVVVADGTAAIAAGSTSNRRGDPYRLRPLLVKVGLTPVEPLPMPNLAISWTGRIRPASPHRVRVLRGRLRLVNTGDVSVPGVSVSIFFSRDDVLDDTDELLYELGSGPVTRGSPVVLKTRNGVRRPAQSRGGRLIAVVDRNGRVVQSSAADDVAASAPLR